MTGDTWRTRPEGPGDVDAEAVRRINVAAFPTAGEADLVDALRRDPWWLDGLSHVALGGDGTPVSHALLTRCLIGRAEALCLAPVAVLPDAQRRGAGSAVVRAVLEAARVRGERCAIVVLGDAAYYPRFGFRRASVHGVLPPMDVPDEAFMVLPLSDAVRVPSGVVRYAAPFGL
ncbi:GNAT family N-acetyltransferase [Streptomyces sp. 8L]|uniref:GNAT family N-acetyltransferase n=1 Tax=Streptomyces sp. 8L TaxID=2877242 RepID=UPI001CD21F10|nr:N-acetyltransferase [Streptomyces sp. 8L]MCA1218582.1 N-acetyltransferase [Streptomyces sp. 8L]